ncbi:Hypothetical predicted protein [Paramuricea clavata]|uniref:Uncharacterized protein n=1 Tax=Paramuricea clavata TaxID=317549 RepID=A0A7D9E8T6_PARCT|nr:Hypothetical predicted protein [Paramuricea clavata]
MGSTQQQQDLQLFLNYQGIQDNDPNRFFHIQQFTDFQFFRLNNPNYTSFDKAYIKWLQVPKMNLMQPNFPDINHFASYPPTNYYPNDLLNIINPTANEEYLLNDSSTTTTKILETGNTATIDKQPIQPTPPLPTPNPLASPTSSQSPPSPEKPAPIGVRFGKDIANLKESLQGQKRIAGKRPPGRPNKHIHLTRIADDNSDEERITSQDIVLLCLDGTEKNENRY